MLPSEAQSWQRRGRSRYRINCFGVVLEYALLLTSSKDESPGNIAGGRGRPAMLSPQAEKAPSGCFAVQFVWHLLVHENNVMQCDRDLRRDKNCGSKTGTCTMFSLLPLSECYA